MTIRKSINVARPPEIAFRVFTEEIGKWWPLNEGFSFGRERAKDIFIEARVGGVKAVAAIREAIGVGPEYPLDIAKGTLPAPVAAKRSSKAKAAPTYAPIWPRSERISSGTAPCRSITS